MDKQIQSRHVRFALLAAVMILTVCVSTTTRYPFVSADGSPLHLTPLEARRDASPAAPSPTQVGPDASVQRVVDLRRPRVKVTGWLGQISSDCWRIDHYLLRTDSGSPIEDDVQTPAFATVIASVDDDGQLQAESVSLRPLPGEVGYPLEFRCLIQDIQPRYWLVCNRVVLITQNTSVQGWPEVGALAEVKGVRLAAGTVLARSVRVTVPDAYADVEFEGPIESIADNVWIVSGIMVSISQVTVVRGVPEAGLIAEVKGILQHDGSVLAQWITVKDPQSSSQVDIEGLVEEIEPTYWQVAGTKVLVDSRTFIDDSRAPAEVGMLAQVRATVRADGSLLAVRIRMSRPD